MSNEIPLLLTSDQRARLHAVMEALRRIAAPVGPMHSCYVWIEELDALDRGLPRLLSLSVEKTLEDAEAALVHAQKEQR